MSKLFSPSVASITAAAVLGPIDGIVCATGNFTTTPATSAGNVVIGRRVDGANPFGGDIDEFRLWNIALTDADVLAHMNGEICTPSNNLVML